MGRYNCERRDMTGILVSGNRQDDRQMHGSFERKEKANEGSATIAKMCLTRRKRGDG